MSYKQFVKLRATAYICEGDWLTVNQTGDVYDSVSPMQAECRELIIDALCSTDPPESLAGRCAHIHAIARGFARPGMNVSVELRGVVGP